MVTTLYTKKEAAATLKISTCTLGRRVKEGRLSSTKRGGKRLFTEAHLNRFIKDGEV